MEIERIGFRHGSADRTGRQVLRRALVSGAAASVASTLALVAFGRREIDDAAAPLNGPSRWVWGRHARHRDGFTWRHTVLGYAIHHAASVFWAVLFERALGRRLASPKRALEAAAFTASTAALVDFGLTPPRLRPGFEKRLSRAALLGVYVAFGLGLAATALAPRRSRVP